MDKVQVTLGLETINEGELQKDFETILPKIIGEFQQGGDKATISINIELKRVPDTSSLVSSTYKIAYHLPSKRKTGMCVIKDTQLKTDPVPVNLFAKKKEENLERSAI